jgi:hypothetical protein
MANGDGCVAGRARVDHGCVRARVVGPVNAAWQGIQRTADSWGFTIDLDTNAISYTPPPDAAPAAQKGRRCDLLHQRILDVLTRAEGADDGAGRRHSRRRRPGHARRRPADVNGHLPPP